MSLNAFEPAPWFGARTHSNPQFVFSSLGGRFVLLGFLPSDRRKAQDAARLVAENADVFRDDHLASFLVTSDEDFFNAQSEKRGRRWFFDPDGAVARLYDARGEEGAESPRWVLIDPSMRVMLIAGLERGPEIVGYLRNLPRPTDHAGVPVHAPVLIVPRVLEPQMCKRLIEAYESQGGTPSGVMREIDGRTVAVLSGFKNRRDYTIEDQAFRAELRHRLARRLVPEIQKAFQFKATHIERYIVACYDAQEGGYFRAHRDNTTAGTAHRRFAVTINLNGDYEGGDLQFAEFGAKTYRAPVGGAVVFSCSMLHEATRVTRGTRYAFLPFLYDEAAAKVRQQNLHLLDTGPALVAER